LAVVLCAVAAVWAGGLLLAAQPLVSDARGETAIAFPAVAALAVAALLHRYCTSGSAAGVAMALVVVLALFVFAFAAILSIGIFVLPVAAALAAAVGLTPRGARTPRAP
jgi:hypothetical protein